MPPHKPSPHRFLAPTSQKSRPKPQQSNLRHGFNADMSSSVSNTTYTHTKPTATHIVTPAKRFVVAPSRSRSDSRIGKGKQRDAVRDEEWGSLELQTHSTPLKKPARKLHRVESIEEASQETPSDTNEASSAWENSDDIAQTVEQSDIFPSDEYREEMKLDTGEAEEDEDEDTDMLFNPRKSKRPRLTPQPQLPSSPPRNTTDLQHQQPPQTPGPAHMSAPGAASHRFLAPAPRTPAPAMVTPAATRPAFLLPRLPTSPQKYATPLPTDFSPSRKGQKYVPEGLASTVQSWAIETWSTGYQAQVKDTVLWGREKDDGVRMRFRITEIGGPNGSVEELRFHQNGGGIFVNGETDASLYNASRMPSGVSDNGTLRVILDGKCATKIPGGVLMKVGSIVGLRSPFWDVDLNADGQKCIVGMDWTIL